MRAFAAGHFDRMADLDHVEPVRVERIHREILERRRRAAAPCANQPAPPPAMNAASVAAIAPYSHLRGCSHQPLELEPLRHRLVGDGVVTRVQRFGHRAPRLHPRGIVGMRREPRLDIAAPLRRQLVVDVGMQFVFGDGNVGSVIVVVSVYS